MLAALGGELNRDAAASVVAAPGRLMSEEAIREAGERIVRLARELEEAARAPVKSRADEAAQVVEDEEPPRLGDR
jgi:hypothetical protein